MFGVGAIVVLSALLSGLTSREGELTLWSNIYGLIALLSGIIFLSQLVARTRKQQDERLNWVVARAIRQGFELAQASSLSAKKRELLTSLGPQTYYYLDPHQIEDLYGQMAIDPSSIEVEEQRSRSTGIGAKLHVLEPRHERGSTVRRLEKYEGNKTIGQKYLLLQQEMLARNSCFGVMRRG
jgi:hypothetical protein